jgi:molybdate transport system substrate-binding protein
VRCGLAVAKENRMRMSRRLTLVLVFAAAIVGHSSIAALAQERTLTVFAAASLKNALDDADKAFTAKTGIKIVASYAATSALAKQIEAGAPADVFISADERWMDYAVAHKLVKPDRRFDLLGNKLVLIAGKDSKLGNVTIADGFDIARLAGDGRIAVADVKSVPAGRYAQAALTKLGAWAAAEKKLAMAENVRAALAYVGRGETPIGIVYATDAAVEPKVKVIGTFPDGSHPKIIYPVAATATTGNPDVAAYLAYLRGADARGVFEHYGFTVLAKPTS